MENLMEKLKDIEMVKLKKPFSLLEMLYKQVYGKEVVQSEMLAGLLNPDENHGHGQLLIESFLEEIGVNAELNKDSNLKIETERNVNGKRIDILISWQDDKKKHAVIIENKLNGAQNQTNQLNNYYESLIAEDYEVDKIIYMPLSKEWQNSEHTDACKEFLQKTVNFDAKDIVNWLEKMVTERSELKNGLVNQYKDLLNCLISNQHIMNTAVKIQKEFSLEEIEKLEEIAKIIRTIEWCEVRFQPIVEELIKNKYAKELIVKYKQDSFGNYAQFYFSNWENTFWYEVWLYPNDGIYLYEVHRYYGKDEYTKIQKFGISETAELVKFIIPKLQELSQK